MNVVGYAVIVVGVLGVIAVTWFLYRQWRMQAPTSSDLRRAGDENRDDYSVYEQGHDIATSYVERGGNF